MDSHPSPAFAELIHSVKTLASEVAARHADDVDANARFPHETLAALRRAQVLSAGVPVEVGGAGCTLHEQAQLCAVLAQSCGSSAMVLAMHYIQLACLARHGMDSEWFRGYLEALVREQYLLASMTSEVGTYGDTRSSICAVQRTADARFELAKDATTGSYCTQADAILVTCRKDEGAAASDQVLVLVRREDCTLTQTGTWDTLGMRGTCSPGFKLRSSGGVDQILPGAYAESSSQTMVPFSHTLWAALWWGIAADAVAKAAHFVRGQARQKPGTVPPTATRLAEVMQQLQAMKQNWLLAAQTFDGLNTPGGRDELMGMAWALRLNNLKMTCSAAAPQIVLQALQIVGILGYKNDSPYSMGRQLRDTLSASLMISNDRILARNAAMLLVSKDSA